jgi:hypothetical protein
MTDANLGDNVTIAAPDDTNLYKVTATSKAKTGAAFHSFMITKASTGAITRSCTPLGKGSCKSDGSW